MNDKLLVETAVLAGEIMLISGAEIFRVEDTIDHILRKAGRDTAESIVFPQAFLRPSMIQPLKQLRWPAGSRLEIPI